MASSFARWAKRRVNAALEPFGFEVARRAPEYTPIGQLLTTLRHFDVDLVVDVGANAGQFAQELWLGGYGGRIISVEPLSAPHAKLCAAARDHPSWKVLPRVALGADEREVEMQVAGNSVSSSVLKVLDLCVQAVPGAASVGAEKVWQTTLDRLVLPELQGARHSLIKVDTQGYEKLVLDGGEACLAAAVLVLLELSLQPLYADQALWLEMIAFMHARGFDVWSVQPEFMDASTAQLMQVNGIFYRSRPH